MKSINTDQKDIFGIAFLDYLSGYEKGEILVRTNIAENEHLPVSYFFRGFDQMPYSEQISLSRCRGKILDAGAGAGSHALYLQEKGHEVTAIDISPGSTECMKRRGIKNPLEIDFFHLKETKFDTILFLMNGLGMAKKMKHLPKFIRKAASLIKPDGSILIESSDLLYLFTDENDIAYINLAGNYYGEISYQLSYKGFTGKPFDWLFCDFDNLCHAAVNNNMQCELIYQSEHHNYIAEIKHRN